MNQSHGNAFDYCVDEDILPVNEIFESIQGEGAYTGQPSIFVRLQGCPVGCPWCDTQHTWRLEKNDQIPFKQMQSKTSDSAHWASADANQLVEHLVDDTYSAKHIVITGGEPCLFDLKPISRALIDAGCSVQVETSGTFEMSIDHRAWVTLSPKVDMPGGLKVLDSSLHRANEIKHPVARLSHVSQLQALLEKLNKNSLPVIYLQPISQQQRATELAMKSCIENNWRLSLQTHKFIGIE